MKVAMVVGLGTIWWAGLFGIGCASNPVTVRAYSGPEKSVEQVAVVTGERLSALRDHPDTDIIFVAVDGKSMFDATDVEGRPIAQLLVAGPQLRAGPDRIQVLPGKHLLSVGIRLAKYCYERMLYLGLPPVDLEVELEGGRFYTLTFDYLDDGLTCDSSGMADVGRVKVMILDSETKALLAHKVVGEEPTKSD